MVRAFLGLAIIASVLASGCFATPPATSVTDASEPSRSLVASPVYPPQEHDTTMPYYAQVPAGATMDSQNMKDSLWQVNIPLGATRAKVSGTWTPSVSVSPNQELMFHEGTTTDVGKPVGDIAHGASPLSTEWVTIPANATTLVVMCHVYGNPTQPLAVEYRQTTHLRVEFS